MLDGMHFGGVHHRLVVGLRKAQVEGRHRLRPRLILPGDVQPRLQFDVVNGKAGYFFHVIPSVFYGKGYHIPAVIASKTARNQWLSPFQPPVGKKFFPY